MFTPHVMDATNIVECGGNTGTGSRSNSNANNRQSRRSVKTLKKSSVEFQTANDMVCKEEGVIDMGVMRKSLRCKRHVTIKADKCGAV